MAGLLPTYANIHFARGFTRGYGDLPHEEVLLHLGPAHYVGIYTTQSISERGANATCGHVDVCGLGSGGERTGSGSTHPP